ncbi:MAG: stage IV sporulation protein A, partial [Bacilli bacterium]|nr:stage IV sporulation protein A [Bacilli bacterium]
SLDTGNGIVTLNLESPDELYNETLKSIMGDININKASILKVFSLYREGEEEHQTLSQALKSTYSSGYGIVYPTLKDMHLETPEIIKQGTRYGVRLKAKATSIHMMKVDVESTFEPIIGTELQSKELINYIMKDYNEDPSSIWKSEIFGRSLDVIVKEGIQAKLSMMPENTRYKLSNTVTKIVNKGSDKLIAIVL